MRLIHRNQAPVGGFYYIIPETNDKVMGPGNLESLVDAVEGYYNLKGLPVPDYLEPRIEDQICMRQPEGRCRYTKGIGDLIARAAAVAAGAIDKVAGTQLKKRARGCSGCARRRQRLNGNAQ